MGESKHFEAVFIREIDHRQRGVIDEVSRARAGRWIRIERIERSDGPRRRIEAVLQERQVALHVGDIEVLVVRRNQDAVCLLFSFVNGRHSFSRHAVFPKAIDIEPPVSVADAEEKRSAAIETDKGGVVIEVNTLVARIAAVSRQTHHRPRHLAPFSAPARDIEQRLLWMRGNDPAGKTQVALFGNLQFQATVLLGSGVHNPKRLRGAGSRVNAKSFGGETRGRHAEAKQGSDQGEFHAVWNLIKMSRGPSYPLFYGLS